FQLARDDAQRAGGVEAAVGELHAVAGQAPLVDLPAALPFVADLEDVDREQAPVDARPGILALGDGVAGIYGLEHVGLAGGDEGHRVVDLAPALDVADHGRPFDREAVL